MAMINCRSFRGDKPCGLSNHCDESCPSRDEPRVRLLIIHLGAMGAVVRATALLAAIKRKFPSSHLTWVTEAPMQQLLSVHPAVDRVLTTSANDQLVLRALEFDVGLVLDKSLVAAGLLSLTTVDQVWGFVAEKRTGAIVPANPGARELWELGLDNHRKFFVNKKSELQLQHEALELGSYRRDEYWLPQLEAERECARLRHDLWSLRADQPVIGFNTGCGPLMPAKKWTVEFHREVLRTCLDKGWRNLVLLGGPEDAERNAEIGRDLPVIQSPVDRGVRDGYASVAACDVVVTGDSLGMHLAIAARRFVVAWFGPSCDHEIDLFERGVRLRTTLGCSPCWKRHCDQTPMCYDHVELVEIERALEQGFSWWQKTTSIHPENLASP